MTVYLCTCGTSAAKKIPRQPAPFNAAWVAEHGGVDQAAKALHASFADYAMTDEEALTRHLSAEVHSLARMGLTAKDRVVLFSSETSDGQACAEALKRYLCAQHPGLSCEVEVVEGLQVLDANRFRTVGVMQFVKRVLHWIKGFGAEQCMLNPTGGFKSLVPYTVLLGMLKGVPARYVFEFSTSLIDLPRMPLEFARERIEPALALLERIEQESFIPQAEFEAALPYSERQALASLFESLEGQVTLSPVGFLLKEELQTPSALTPYLSRMAFHDLDDLRREGYAPEAFLRRVAASPEALEKATHLSWGDGFVWLKPGDTRDRYLVSKDGWRLLVWRMALHPGSYEEWMQRHRESLQPPKMLADRSRYAPFVRLDLYEGPGWG